MIKSFKKFLKNESSYGNGAMMLAPGGDTQAMAGHPLSMPDIEIVIPGAGTVTPYVTRKSRVKSFISNKNPMYIELMDGTKMFMNMDEYKRIKGDLPLVPKHTEITVYFQRLPVDLSPQSSQIIFCKSKFMGDATLRKVHGIGTENLMANEIGIENPVGI
jgi:hypothetical protein